MEKPASRGASQLAKEDERFISVFIFTVLTQNVKSLQNFITLDRESGRKPLSSSPMSSSSIFGLGLPSSLSGNSELGRLATDFLVDEPDGRSLKTLAYPFHLVSSVAHRFTPTGS
jgi:hypothetical protein